MVDVNKKLNAAVVIARAQLTHFGHGSLFSHGLKIADKLIIVLGSAFRARDIRNPFTWQERKQMILFSLPVQDRERVEFLPVRDYFNDERWVAAVREGVAALTERTSTIALVGHLKPDTNYLHQFPGWSMVNVDPEFNVDATSLRKVYFTSNLDVGLSLMGNHVSPTVLEYLKAFSCLPEYEDLRNQWAIIDAYKKKYSAPYYLTGDAIVEINDHVLMIQRGGEVGYGLWAFPGGFLNEGEQFYAGAKRELKEETSYNPLSMTLDAHLRDSQVFDHALRSVRGRIVTQAFQFRMGSMREFPEVKAKDDAKDVKFIHKNDLAAMEGVMFEDHAVIADRFYNIFTPKIATA